MNELAGQPDRGERLGRTQAAAAEPRVVHEHQMAQRLYRRPLAADALVFGASGIPRSRSIVAAQPARSCRKACRKSAGSAERISSRTGCRRSSSASTYDVTSTPLTTKLLTSPRSWSSNLAIPGSIHRRTDTPHAMRLGRQRRSRRRSALGRAPSATPSSPPLSTPASRSATFRWARVSLDRHAHPEGSFGALCLWLCALAGTTQNWLIWARWQDALAVGIGITTPLPGWPFQWWLAAGIGGPSGFSGLILAAGAMA
jgi:hypothetical protein